MRVLIVAVATLVAVGAIAYFTLASSKSEDKPLPSDKCVPYSSCWPDDDKWQSLNDTVDGNLLLVRPWEEACMADLETPSPWCEVAEKEYANAWFRDSQPGAMMMPVNECNYWTAECCLLDFGIPNPPVCHQGAIAPIAVNATKVEYVQAAVRFAKENNIALTVKSTGHDFQGRSTSAESLNVWVHYMKEVTYLNEF